MSRWKILAGVLTLQALLGLVYLAVESGRTPAVPLEWEALDEVAPVLDVERAGVPMSLPDGPYLVHFWATWCAPCVDELPALIAACEAEGVVLLAVTDEPWSLLEAWFEGPPPAAVVHDPSGQAASQWGVSGLPDTFVVESERVTQRMGGPRDWSASSARQHLRALQR